MGSQKSEICVHSLPFIVDWNVVEKWITQIMEFKGHQSQIWPWPYLINLELWPCLYLNMWNFLHMMHELREIFLDLGWAMSTNMVLHTDKTLICV